MFWFQYSSWVLYFSFSYALLLVLWIIIGFHFYLSPSFFIFIIWLILWFSHPFLLVFWGRLIPWTCFIFVWVNHFLLLFSCLLYTSICTLFCLFEAKKTYSTHCLQSSSLLFLRLFFFNLISYWETKSFSGKQKLSGDKKTDHNS